MEAGSVSCREARMDLALQRELAQLLATLRREGRQQSGLDARLMPPDKRAAYRVARMVAVELGWPIAGWKIAAIKEEMQTALRTDCPICVFAPMLKGSPVSVVHAELCSPIPEVEYEARLASDLPPCTALHEGGG
jgi:2-oxo-hept-3-ene-1,7-dioate hydratase